MPRRQQILNGRKDVGQFWSVFSNPAGTCQGFQPWLQMRSWHPSLTCKAHRCSLSDRRINCLWKRSFGYRRVFSAISFQPDLLRIQSEICSFHSRYIGRESKIELFTEEKILQHLGGVGLLADKVLDAEGRLEKAMANTILDLGSEELGREQASSFEKYGPHEPIGPYEDIINRLSDVAFDIVAHPNTFITPQILQTYVNIQARLGKAETLGRVFELYAQKPVPRRIRGGIKYVQQNPSRVKQAIPIAIAETALDAAIASKNLNAAVAVIQSSYDTPAFRRWKLMSKALVPSSIVIFGPAAAYQVASNLAAFQNTMDENTATYVAFAGILAYVTFTSSLGLISRLTFNDQMKRVTWAPGMPLRYRWLREEQRAAYDKVACAWGFKESYRFGEETGDEWDALREYIGHKGMELDCIGFMDGMQ